MTQSNSARAYGYEMPPVLIHSLIYGTTWALSCPRCQRRIAVDVIRMVESVADVRETRAPCSGRLSAKIAARD